MRLVCFDVVGGGKVWINPAHVQAVFVAPAGLVHIVLVGAALAYVVEEPIHMVLNAFALRGSP